MGQYRTSIILKIRIMYWAWKLGLKYSDLHGVWLALEAMANKKPI